MSQQLIDAIIDMREATALATADKLLKKGTNPLDVLEACRKAMEIVGQRYAQGAYFLPELLLAGEMMARITDLVKPGLPKPPDVRRHGKVLIGTVAGDIHDIGKNIVAFLLDVNGFDVLDLGVDVSATRFTDAIRDFQPQVIGLSGFLTLAFDAMKNLVGEIEKTGRRSTIKIMIGGGQVDEQVLKHTGADAFGRDAMAAVSLARQWIGGQ